MSSRDARRLYGIAVDTWTVFEESETPGLPWASVGSNGDLLVTSGEGENDDRYLRKYTIGRGFDQSYRVALPDFTGSYLSYDGKHVYLSQWYKHRILRLNPTCTVMAAIQIGAEVCGHVFAREDSYVLRGTEADGEDWHVARVSLSADNPSVKPIARVPFACRSLAFDGVYFWTNHRAAGETIRFSLPTT